MILLFFLKKMKNNRISTYLFMFIVNYCFQIGRLMCRTLGNLCNRKRKDE